MVNIYILRFFCFERLCVCHSLHLAPFVCVPRNTVLNVKKVYEETRDTKACARTGRLHSIRMATMNTQRRPAMLGVIMSDGQKLPPFWYEGTMDEKKYKSYLFNKVFPALNSTYSENNYIWTQEGAPAHTCNAVQGYLERKLGSSGFWSKQMWQTLSSNLNPLDFRVWTHEQKKACTNPHPNVDSLKNAVEECWASMSEDYIKSCCRALRCQVWATIDVQGGAFEK